MKRLEFQRQLELEHSAEHVFRWHQRPGAFARLSPPWQAVHMCGAPKELALGDVQRIELALGPLRLPWVAEITHVEPGREFRDLQRSGPFAHWEHTHSMIPRDAGTSVLRDHIEYAIRFGALGRIFAGGYVRSNLDRLFTYRHRITMEDLARHKSASDRETETLDILVTGSSGLVGSALCAFLSTGGHRVRSLVRRESRNENEFRWDIESGAFDAAALEGVDAVIHLAGENIAARRWSAAQKERIERSRVAGTRLLVDAIHAAPKKPRAFLCASAIGIYGARGDEVLDESSAHGTGFLADVGRAWEAEAARCEGARTVMLRFGVILSAKGGALKKMLLPFKLGGGGRLGSGEQWMSWVSLDDVLGAIHHALITESLEGPVNVVAPNAVKNAEYTKTLGKVLSRPTIFPMPAFAARLAFGELADELLLNGQHVKPTKLVESGYRFAQPELEDALRHQLGRAQ